MKTANVECVNLIREEDLQELLKETKETLATYGRQEETERSFGPVDMWNRQKHQRTSLQMRRWLN